MDGFQGRGNAESCKTRETKIDEWILLAHFITKLQTVERKFCGHKKSSNKKAKQKDNDN